jgi:hypothetical protein
MIATYCLKGLRFQVPCANEASAIRMVGRFTGDDELAWARILFLTRLLPDAAAYFPLVNIDLLIRRTLVGQV